MRIEIFSVDENLSESIEVQSVAEAEIYIALVQEHGFEDDSGNRYKFGDAKVTPQGAVIYVDKES